MVYIINTEVCSGCGACTDACPNGAIQWQPDPETEPLRAITPVPAEQPAEIVALTDPTPARPVRETVVSTLVWAGSELVPRLADFALDYLEHRAQRQPPHPEGQNRRGDGRRAGRAGRQPRKRGKRAGYRDCRA